VDKSKKRYADEPSRRWFLTLARNLEAIEAARADPAVPTDARATRAGQGAWPPCPAATAAARLHRPEGASQARNADALRTGRRPMNMLQGVRRVETVVAFIARPPGGSVERKKK
jgi:hypothetical protein